MMTDDNMKKDNHDDNNEELLAPEDDLILDEAVEEQEQLDEDPQQEIEQLKSQLLLLHADMDNLRKRTIREKEEASAFAIKRFANDLLPVMDNFLRALVMVDDEKRNELSPEMQSFVDGIIMTKDELDKAFNSNNLKRFESLDQKFDSNIHQAVAKVDCDTHETGQIVNVMQDGYKLNDRLVRPAMVSVAK